MKIRKKAYALSVMISAMIITSPLYAYADSLSSAEQAAEGITSWGWNLVKKILPIVVFFVGLACLVGGQRAREGIKEGAVWKIAGLILMAGAASIGAKFAGWF